MSIILGISDSHEAHACLLIDGKLSCAVAEERLTRLKADMGYPKNAIEAVLKISGISPQEIDIISFAGTKGTPFHALYKINALFSVKDWIDQCHKYWKPILLEGKPLTSWDDFEMFKHVRGKEILKDPYFKFVEQYNSSKPSEFHSLFNKIRLETVVDHLKISKDKIKFYRHEDCHKIFGVLSSPKTLEESIVLTLEGGGDDSSATYSIQKNKSISEIWSSNTVNLGRLYRYVTLLLGMKPSQHEYKVMGLAPYGNEYNGKFSLEFFNSLSYVDKHKIIPTNIVKDLYFSVQTALEGERFDGIAWGLQEHLEQILVEWVENCIKETGIKNVVLSGGVGQNIKASKKIIDNTSLNYFWAGPICGDGSLGIGAAFLAFNESWPNENLKNLDSIYLGTEYNLSQIDKEMSNFVSTNSFNIIRGYSSKDVASWLAEGKICARFSGQMEFGQRALGNRSIIADPRNSNVITKINQKVKNRDFWMPFTPSMTHEESRRSILNNKNIYSPYMTIAFDLKNGFSEKIPGAIHPADNSVRPQMLKKDDNPKYYSILESFGEISGAECLLNTSFNLHGDPIVESPKQALQTFEKTDIDVLLFDHVAICR